VTPELMLAHGLVSSGRIDIKVLADGKLTKKLSVTAHRFSAAAREKIEKAGGTATALREPVEKKVRHKRKAKPAVEESEAASEEPASEEPASEEPVTEA
jgi:large subunit ribosomal protein L15